MVFSPNAEIISVISYRRYPGNTICQIISSHGIISSVQIFCAHGPFARYAKLQVVHAPGMPGTFCPPLGVSDPDMHHGTCVTHMPWCMTGSPTSCFRSSRWRGKRSRRMRNLQFCVSGKRFIGWQVNAARRSTSQWTTDIQFIETGKVHFIKCACWWI